MKKLFGNGRPLAIAVFAIGVVAIAVPAFGASSGGTSGGGGSSGGSSSGSGSSSSVAPSLAPSPPPLMALSGKSKKELEQTATCMKDHGIAPPPDASQAPGSTPAKPPSSSEFQAAANACGLPRAPGGGLPPPPMGAPGALGAPGKLDSSAVQRCLHARAKKQAHN